MGTLQQRAVKPNPKLNRRPHLLVVVVPLRVCRIRAVRLLTARSPLSSTFQLQSVRASAVRLLTARGSRARLQAAEQCYGCVAVQISATCLGGRPHALFWHLREGERASESEPSGSTPRNTTRPASPDTSPRVGFGRPPRRRARPLTPSPLFPPPTPEPKP
jgi:hypothetical protein